ncbi:hypothetical protein D915_003811 [Fasciola hepatica]|uniref:Uncharacterized protein n=1 Tax=Fasciola hepatica TaxID=6192 RepID=A0A4E0RF56_FASHE|nr:hypothetical protein D915_003811 [Fasciola hepatica]
MVQKRYSCTDEGILKRVIQAFKDGHDGVRLPNNSINYKTAYNLADADELRYERQPRGRTRRETVNDTEIDETITWAEEDPTTTLDLLRIRV